MYNQLKFKQMKVVALLTGRGNNTLKDKNVLPVLGKPLLYYPAMAAKSCKLITDFYVSSDDDKILNAAADCGYKKNYTTCGISRTDITTRRCNYACIKSHER